MKKILLILMLIITLGIYISCGNDSPDPNIPEEEDEIEFSLSIQNNVLMVGESNVFMVSIVNLKDGIDYNIKYYLKEPTSDEFTLLRSTQSKSTTYKPSKEGVYGVKASLEYDNDTYESESIYFEVKGYGGTYLGASPTGLQPSKNIDFTNDLGVNPSIEHQSVPAVTDEYSYFKNINHANFVISSKIDIIAPNASDPYPKSGLFFRIGSTYHYVCFDARPTYDNDDLVYVIGTPGSWAWPGLISHPGASFREGTNRLSVRLTLVRNASTLYLLVDDEFVAAHDIGSTAASIAGTYTMASNTIFSNYYSYVGTDPQYNTILQDAVNQMNDIYGYSFGVSPLNDIPTSNINYDGDTETSNTIIHNSSSLMGDEYTYSNSVNSTKTIISADIDIVGINGGDSYPKVGLFNKIGSTFHYFSFDYRPTYTSDEIVYASGYSGSWTWGTVAHYAYHFRQDTERLTVNMTLIRENDDFYVLVDGTLVMKKTISNLGEASVVGTFTMSTNAIYSNLFACNDDETKLDDVYSIYLADAKEQFSTI